MRPFKYSRVRNEQDAIATASQKKVKYIGGGTNLLDLMKLNIETPEQLVDINGLGLDKIEETADGGIHIGALVRNSDLAYDERIRQKYPLLSQALLAGASSQLRNMATVGGNLMQRTRCPYFYGEGFACNKRVPGSGCAALTGYNRSHAVLGASSQCIATHPSDMCVALVALGAKVLVKGEGGLRSIPVRNFHLLPGDTPYLETVLNQGELIIGVDIPALPFAANSCYLKVRDRASYEFALASAAVALDIRDGKIRQALIAMGGVGTKPWHAREAEQALTGAVVSLASFQAAAESALQQAQPHEHNAFKIELAKRTLVRALSTTGGLI